MPITELPSVDIDGVALRRARKLAGLNLADLARAADISESYVSHIELGRRKAVTPKTFGRLCDALGVADRRVLMRCVAFDSEGAV